MPITEVTTGQFSMPDSERSAYGLGFEYHRREQGIEHNPFPTESQRYRWFRDGWMARRELQLAKQVRADHGVV